MEVFIFPLLITICMTLIFFFGGVFMEHKIGIVIIGIVLFCLVIFSVIWNDGKINFPSHTFQF